MFVAVLVVAVLEVEVAGRNREVRIADYSPVGEWAG